MIRNSFLMGGVLVLWVYSSISGAASLYENTSTMQSSDPTQLGVIGSDITPSDWSGTKEFPGEVATTLSFHYETFSLNVGSTPYIQVSIDDFDDPDYPFFASAYLGSYDPNDKVANYLGDMGSYGNQYGNPGFFQVVAPANSILVLLVNERDSSIGIGKAFHLSVEGFIDTAYGEPAPVPIPAAAWLFGSAVVSLGGLARKRAGG